MHLPISGKNKNIQEAIVLDPAKSGVGRLSAHACFSCLLSFLASSAMLSFHAVLAFLATSICRDVPIYRHNEVLMGDRSIGIDMSRCCLAPNAGSRKIGTYR